jgi:hypothetical protein
MRMILLALALALVPNAMATKPMASERSQQAELRALARHVTAARVSTWHCQQQLSRERTKAAVDAGSLPQSVAYRRWVVTRWEQRRERCERLLSQKTIPANWDWPTAVRLVQRIYPGTEDWLLFISHREGGWGRFVMNSQGSGAGGWMLFMSSTYYAYNDRAFADARRRGFIIPESANSWTHPMGQAITAGYMRYVGLDGCHWCL